MANEIEAPPGLAGGAQSIRTSVIRAPGDAACYQAIRAHKVGSRMLSPGEVVRIATYEQRTGSLYPVDDQLHADRARDLVQTGYGRMHPGPATNSVKARPPLETLGIEVPLKQPAAERAVAPRQRGGA